MSNAGVGEARRAGADAKTAGAFACAIRGIYDHEDDPEFERVRTFESSEDCTRWTSVHAACTNPRYPQCRQLYTTLCDWEQVQYMLLSKISEYRAKYGVQPPPALPATTVFAPGDAARLRDNLRACLDRPFHSRTNEESTLNTLRYLFFHMRCGIFVMIRRNKLILFVPFVNKDYVNTWGGNVPIEDGMTVEEYSQVKAATTSTVSGKKAEVYIADQTRWWANGNIMCNVDSPNFWGDAYLPQLRDMLQSVCAERQVADCEFFINKRDFPQLKRNASEPYDFIYDADDVPLSREAYTSYAPIASFFVGSDFADVPMVTTDDWETATGMVYPPAAIDIRSAKNRKANDVAWKDRVATAFFRGNSTGPGTDDTSNQRIKLARISQQWKVDGAKQMGNPTDGISFLDAGIVGWNLRDRKLQGQPMTHIKPAALALPTVDRVPMYAQSKYKYQMYVDGHCAAMRYASMMPLGSVILKVDSYTKAGEMWYFPLLRPYDVTTEHPDPEGDHIRVAMDLSNLGEVIAWCKTHDAECERIASNSRALYERVIAREGQLDYLQLLLHEMASRFTPSGPRDAQEGERVGSSVVAGGASSVSEVDGVPAAQASRLSKLDATRLASSAAELAAQADAEQLGAAPTVFAPHLTEYPTTGCPDWFGPSNPAYTSCLIGPSMALPPVLPEFAHATCECSACTAKKELAAAAAEHRRQEEAAEARTKAMHTEAERKAHQARAAIIAKIHEEKAAALGGAGAGAGAGASSRSTATSFTAPALKMGNIEKMRAEAARRAELAQAKASERDREGAGPAKKARTG